MKPSHLCWTLALAFTACTGGVADNPFLDGGFGLRAVGESCSRDVQCALPYRCVQFTCGTPPDAAVLVDASVTVDAAVVPDAAIPVSSSSLASSAQGSSAGSTSGVSSGSSAVGSSSSGGATSQASSGATGAALGADCTLDADCQSTLCKEVYAGSTVKVCVKACTQAADCGVDGSFFCDPATAGATNGFCVPRSPAHCRTCSVDGDCGRFSETCVTPPGEGSPVCQVDCSLGGANACPADYTCATVMLAGQPRSLCRPNTGVCSGALGGFCDRAQDPQPCAPASDAGVCNGTRTCGGDHRYTACSASAPDCLGTCATPQPAGCSVARCANAANTASDCGTCGMGCPAATDPTASVTCVNAMTCAFACAGSNYDLDNSVANGCEYPDDPLNNHTAVDAFPVGSFPCGDGASTQNIAGRLPNDARQHVPAIPGFNATAGTAPDFLRIRATGGICTNDAVLTLQVSGATAPTCFALTVTTDKGTYPCTTNAAGACTIPTGDYSDDTDITLKVEQTCSTASAPTATTYQVTGHL